MVKLKKEFEGKFCYKKFPHDNGNLRFMGETTNKEVWGWIIENFEPKDKDSNRLQPRVKPFATEICIAHVKDGIEEYNRDAYKKCEEQLLKIIAILYHAQVDIKVKDIIPVEKGDIYWYKIKERTLDLGEVLRITYWVDDLG